MDKNLKGIKNFFKKRSEVSAAKDLGANVSKKRFRVKSTQRQLDNLKIRNSFCFITRVLEKFLTKEQSIKPKYVKNVINVLDIFEKLICPVFKTEFVKA